MNGHHIRLTAKANLTAEGFDVLAITAGEGNGWLFPATVLQASLPLWDKVNSFIDHAPLSEHPSLLKLAGVTHSPQWNDAAQGVQVKIRPTGPHGPTLAAFGREMLAARDAGQPTPDAGFSADLWFKSEGKTVTQILKVDSLDLVIDPARGGDFIRALNQRLKEAAPMPEATSTPTPATAQAEGQGGVQTQLQNDLQAVKTLLDVQTQQAQLAKEAEEARAVRLAMCGHLLESGLAASRLPAPMQAHVRQQFTGKVFNANELTAAIDSARELVSQLSGPAAVKGLGAVSAMFSSADRLQAAVNQLFGVPDEGAPKTARLSGIRELYHALTGDFDYHGGYYPERAQFATTADFTGLVKNALNKIVVNQWEMLGRAGYDWWQKIVRVEHFSSLQSITGTLIGTVGELPEVLERGEYTELAIGDSPETASFTKYGGYVPLTLELIDRDETRKLIAYGRELANAGLRRLSSLVAAIFTANSAVGPTMADTGALFNSTAVTTAGGHANLLTTALGTDYTAWNAVSLAMYNQAQLIKNAAGYYGTGPKLAIEPRFCLVPRALKIAAEGLFIPRWEAPAQNVAAVSPTWGGRVEPITVPEWTDATDWAAVADPAIAPAIFVGERFGLMPEVFIAGDNLSPAVFMNDESRMKVRTFSAVWVNDFRPLHKSNVA